MEEESECGSGVNYGGVRGFPGDVMIRFGALGYARDKRVARDGRHPDGRHGRVAYSASGLVTRERCHGIGSGPCVGKLSTVQYRAITVSTGRKRGG